MYPRLSYFRLFLAWAVLAYHMDIDRFPAAGPIAVWGFFFVSGYLVSEILGGRYADRPGDFLINRFLRIFPAYWTALGIGVLIAFFDPEGAAQIAKAIAVPDQFHRWLQNLFLYDVFYRPQVVPPAPSLVIELHWYIVFFVCHFLPARWVLWFFIANLTVPIFMLLGGGEVIYTSGAGFAFASGALMSRYPPTIPLALQRVCLAIIPAILFLMPLWVDASGLRPSGFGLNICLILFVPVLYGAFPWFLADKRQNTLSRWAGDLSYPIFLVHMFAGWLAMTLFDIERLGIPMVIWTTVFSVLLSVAIVLAVERPIGRMRSKIRERSAAILARES